MACDYLVAADGARSPLRHALGVRLDGQPALQHLLNIHFQAPAVGAALLERDGTLDGVNRGAQTLRGGTLGDRRHPRGAMLYFVFNADVVAVLVAHDLRTGTFVAQARCNQCEVHAEQSEVMGPGCRAGEPALGDRSTKHSSSALRA